MANHTNPFVTYLNKYTTASPEHEAAFDEFITQVSPPFGQSLRLDTKIEQFLLSCFQRQQPPSVILTGNAGDGKTYLCRQVIQELTRQPVTDWANELDHAIDHNGITIRVVKDLSEMGEQVGSNTLLELAVEQLEAQPSQAFLIAANEGRLRAVLKGEELNDLYQKVDRQLQDGPDLDNDHLIVLNLNHVTTSTFVPQSLAWMTDPIHWGACTGCPALNSCPIRFNAHRLADPHIAGRMQRLYQVLEHLELHVTIRDMLIHLAYTITGGLSCQTVIDNSRDLGWEMAYKHVYYENVWGEMADETFRYKTIVMRHLRHLNVGESSVFATDDFIINGQPANEIAQAEHERLFAPALDLGKRHFIQDREAYLHGGTSSPRPNEDYPLMRWLPHCRRKLFFEWQDTKTADRLFPFLYLSEYFRLLQGDRALLDRYLYDLVLGLNRAFSGLYLTDNGYLYVTSQYAHAVEQPVPIVLFRVATGNIELNVNTPKIDAYDCDQSTLQMEIPLLPRAREDPVKWIKWDINLLRFEYLVRRARGGTSNVLAAECELAIRQLKDELLSKYVADDEEPNKIVFFAASRHSYKLQTLWVDQDGIRMQRRG